MLQGRLGLLLHQPGRRRQAHLAARAGDARRHRRLAGPRAGHRAARRHLLRRAPLFLVRPHRLDTLAFVGFSLPTFFTGLLLILLFSIKLDWLPLRLPRRPRRDGLAVVVGEIKQSIMPVFVLGLFQGASWTRYVRSAVLDVIRLDYVTTARSKGIGRARVILKHVVRNALIPVVTLVALTMPQVFGGAIVTEQIFRIPGIGSLLIDANPAQRHAGDHGRDLRLLVPRDPLQPHRRHALWLARPPASAIASAAAVAPLAAVTVETSGRRRVRNVSPAAEAWRRFRRHKLAVVGLVVLAVMVLMVAVGPLVWKLSRSTTSTSLRPDSTRPAPRPPLRHRRPRPGHLRPHALRRPHLARRRRRRDADGDARRRQRSAPSPASRAAGRRRP